MEIFMKRSKSLKRITDFVMEILTVLIGSILFAMAINMFIVPGGIMLGGATGVSTTINHLLPTLPVGTLLLAVNVHLMIAALKIKGLWESLRTLIGIIVSSVIVDLTGFLPVTINDPLLCSILGGALIGLGGGVLLSRGYTTGGSDLAAFLLKTKIKRLPTGKIIMIIDLIVIAGSAVILNNFTGIFYSIIATIISSFAFDAVLGGNDKAKLAYIVSNKPEDIADSIYAKIDRGITVLYGKGYYTKSEKNVLMCVVKRSEVFALKEIVNQCDKDAFVILTDATEVLGMGFKSTATSDDSAQPPQSKQ